MKRLLALASFLFGCHAPATPGPYTEPGLATLAIMDPDGVRCSAVVITPNTFVTASQCTSRETINYSTFGQDTPGVGLATRLPHYAWSPLSVYVTPETFPIRPQLRVTPEHEQEIVLLVSHTDRPWNVVQTRVAYPMIWIDSAFHMTTLKELGSHDRGAGLWSLDGELLGVALYNDGPRSYYAHALEVARVIRASKAP